VLAATTLRALSEKCAGWKEAFDRSAALRADDARDLAAAIARAEAAERRVAELSLYRTIVSAWLAGRGMTPELDAHMAALPEGDRPVDPERDALVAVARAARVVAEWREVMQRIAPQLGGTLRSIHFLELALDALPPGVLDQSSG